MNEDDTPVTRVRALLAAFYASDASDDDVITYVGDVPLRADDLHTVLDCAALWTGERRRTR